MSCFALCSEKRPWLLRSLGLTKCFFIKNLWCFVWLYFFSGWINLNNCLTGPLWAAFIRDYSEVCDVKTWLCKHGFDETGLSKFIWYFFFLPSHISNMTSWVQQSYTATSAVNNLDLSGYNKQAGLHTTKVVSSPGPLESQHKDVWLQCLSSFFFCRSVSSFQSSPVQSCESVPLLCTSLTTMSVSPQTSWRILRNKNKSTFIKHLSKKKKGPRGFPDSLSGSH